VLDNDLNKKFNLYVKDLNRIYRDNKALFEVDFDQRGFQWIDFSDAVSSILAFYRASEDGNEILVFTFNMTPVLRENYGFGVPKPGYYKEILNSDAEIYGGSGKGNLGGVQSKRERSNQWENSIKVTLPPLAVVVFKLEKGV
jgi:1,4-alpha-glucan branching enzyme